jgi:hypothetical protein
MGSRRNGFSKEMTCLQTKTYGAILLLATFQMGVSRSLVIQVTIIHI